MSFRGHVADDLIREGVSLAHAPSQPQAQVVHSVIIVGRDTGSRNIFFDAGGMVGAHDSLPAEELIGAAKVLFIDHCGMRGNLRAARAARAGGVPIVADFEDATAPGFHEVLELVDHLVLSEGFALRLTRAATPAEAALALWRPDRAAVIVTCGPEGCWSVSPQRQDAARHHPAFAVKATDTAGCGDVFHGAYAACLARGDELARRIRFASAAAALKARDGGIPWRAAIEQFLAQDKTRSQTHEPSRRH